MTRSFALPSLQVVSFAALSCFAGAACVSDGSEPGRAEYALAVAPSLGAAETFAILAGSAVTNTGPSMIVGDVGVSPGTSISGFPPGTVTGGSLHSADGPAALAQASLTTAYNDAAGQPCDTILTGVNLGGTTQPPGVYCFATSAQLTGTLTLDGMGDSNSVWVFKVGSTLTTASSSAVIMIGNGIPGRVFWQVGSSATMGTGTAMQGNILAQASITLTTGATLNGRALARTGAVTIDNLILTLAPVMVAGGPDAGMPDGDMPDGDILDADINAPDAESNGAGGLSGGAAFPFSNGCSVSTGSSGGGAGAVLLLLGVVGSIVIRRRRNLLALLALVPLALPGIARADSVTLDQFHPAETSEDGIEVSRPIDLGHNRLGMTAYISPTNNPLVFETTAGNADTQTDKIVGHTLALHIGVAYGLIDRVVLFGGTSVNLLMVGDDRMGFVSADGTRMGDLILGGRVRLLGTPQLRKSSYGALALQAAIALPTAHMFSSSSQLSGEGGVMVTPELVGEIGGRHARLTLNVGARFRGTEAFNTLSIGHELIAGLGLGVPVSKAWEIDVEAFGATGFADFFKRQNSPVEALGGVRWRSENGWTAALAAGPGIARGYGSPDFRAVATVGWHQPAPKETVWEPIAEVAEAPPPPPPPADWDKDGIIDTEDKCPRVPGPKENDGCALYVALVPDEVAPVEIVIMQRIEFDTDNSVVLPAGEVVLEEIRALLAVNPQLLKIAIEGHADERASDKYNMELSRRRSDAVKRWLTDHGIAADRLQSRGYGEREPFVSGTTAANQQTNRNVQFFITSPAASVPSR